MTEQEAEAWVTRLERIWKPRGHVSWRKGGHRVLYFDAVIVSQSTGEEIYLVVIDREGEDYFEYNLLPSGDGAYGLFTNDCGDVCFPDPCPNSTRQQQFSDEWTHLFRRGCWLSGCPIEASAHEKAEWMQGFSREELQAWKLIF